MSSILAKIVYPSGGGTTLTFVYPARNVAYYDGEPTRYDARSNSGIHVSTLSRVDHFLKFNMPFIAAGADAAAWQAFLDWAAAARRLIFIPTTRRAVTPPTGSSLAGAHWHTARRACTSWMAMKPCSRSLRTGIRDSGFGTSPNPKILWVLPASFSNRCPVFCHRRIPRLSQVWD